MQLSNRQLLVESIEEVVLQLIETLSRDSVLVMHYAVTSTREGLHGMMQCYRRQHVAASIEAFIVVIIYEDEIHEHSDGIFKDAIGTEWIHVETRVIFIHLLGELLWKICPGNLVRTRMNPDMHTILLDQLGDYRFSTRNFT